ncbi:MAG: hypothetical protein L0Y71_08675 [Gemmataceae bacterium]|nr:hypothetical protein [Gemmataceae bacterium]
MSTTIDSTDQREVAILARVLGNGDSPLPSTIARYILHVGFGEDDKARMHDLAVRNQEDALSAAEKDELFAYSKAGTIISILKSKARRTLQIKPKKRTTS